MERRGLGRTVGYSKKEVRGRANSSEKKRDRKKKFKE